MVKYTRGVRYLVGRDNLLIVAEDIITSIRNQMVDGLIQIKPDKLEKGHQVLINDGPFKGFYGIFERYIKGSDRIIMLLNALHSKVEIDSWMVRPCPKIYLKKNNVDYL